MKSIHFKISKPEEKLITGSNKLLGNPDVWEKFEWPYIEENGEKYDLTFMCQINCAQAAAFDKNNLLPKKGMLYFFYDLDTMPEAPDTKSARVIWYNGDMSALHEMILTDEEGNSLAFSEYKIDIDTSDINVGTTNRLIKDNEDNMSGADDKSTHQFIGDIAQYEEDKVSHQFIGDIAQYEEDKGSHLMFGDAVPDAGDNYDCIRECILLLQLGSIETEDVEIRFKDNGCLCFYIDEDKLAARDFSDVKAAQVVDCFEEKN